MLIRRIIIFAGHFFSLFSVSVIVLFFLVNLEWRRGEEGVWLVLFSLGGSPTYLGAFFLLWSMHNQRMVSIFGNK